MAVNYTGFSSAPQLVTKVTGGPASMSPYSTTPISLTVAGAVPGMHFIITAPSLDADLAIGGAYCATAGTVVVRIVNPTAGTVALSSQTFYILGL